ncbi:MAG: dihydroxy-acid dehydratase [Deltaproteobacteria bacterium]|nr:dihydroxy-acid dehydratase [Deltaproteobacteria bacterium]
MTTIPKRDEHLPDYAMVERQNMIRGIGYGDEALERPQIGVVSSWGEVNPAAIHLDRVTGAVKAGIWAAGGTPREFVISSICTSMAGHDNYHLPHRDLVAGYIETVAMTNLFDAMVFVPVCDDVIPAHLMAAARLDLPAVVVTGGYMQLNTYRGEVVDPLDVAPRHYAAYKAGRLQGRSYADIRERGCPGCGACPVMGTANTMACLSEALGMSLPWNATTPGADSRLMRLAFQAGRQVVGLHNKGVRPSDIMSMDAFKNAIAVLMAVGGSTNGVLHLQATAAELDIDIPLEVFNAVSRKTPLLCDIAPSGSGRHLLRDFDEAGGLPSAMKTMQPLLAGDVMTVTGATLSENLKSAADGDGVVIRTLEKPLSSEGGLIFLKGNLAPGGALIKKSAVPAAMHRHHGPARIFVSEESACKALEEGRLKRGDVVVVRNVGPKGDPGMRLLQRFLWQLSAKGLSDTIAFMTDGRFSGTNKGCAVAHITPEAAAGGPLAIVEDGDLIEIDIPGERLRIGLTDEEIDRRLANWSPPRGKDGKGYLSIYSKMANTAEKGAALNYKL